MSTNRCEQILAEVDNDVTMAVYRIFSEAETNENITAKNWEDFAAGLDDGDRKRVDEVVCNLTHAWVQSKVVDEARADVELWLGKRGI
ncbi:hypothetical protein J4E85_009517 [Alternaria conjuncta]|uniref:uncharacterized protein n=1 Tax=Alternaria conjuncta TaxID=181017 RepID=UPI00221FD4BC|nr:uncharacterized protein J4E85_009517 [Alternaria conjuncta]KAI4919259.1 hypothetical protein J4E85_009517 [Alternaria conjuncta]